MYFTYLLRCADDTLYCGFTTDLERRQVAHNEGKGAKYTRSRLPVTIVYAEVFATEQEARKREYAIKKLSRRQKEALMIEKRNNVTQSTMTIEDYKKLLAPQAALMITRLEEEVRLLVPEVTTKISYGIPTFQLAGRTFLYCAAFAHHIGMYPFLHDLGELEQDVALLRHGKATLRFPLEDPMPWELIRKLILFQKNHIA